MSVLAYPAADYHVHESGSGVPVVALHGSASTGSQWRSLTGCLEGRYRVIAPDLPGHGRSPALQSADAPSLKAQAERLAAFLERFDEPVHLVGHSFGGAVALKTCLIAPERVRSLTLIEPAAFHLLREGDREDQRMYGEIENLANTLYTFAREGDPWCGMGRFVDFWNGEKSWYRTSHKLRQNMANSAGQVMDDFLAIDAEQGTVEELAEIHCPTFCIMGLKSPLVSLRVTELLAISIPGAQLAMVHDAGHMLPLTDPHIVDPAIRSHLMAVDEELERAPRMSRPGAISEAA